MTSRLQRNRKGKRILQIWGISNRWSKFTRDKKTRWGPCGEIWLGKYITKDFEDLDVAIKKLKRKTEKESEDDWGKEVEEFKKEIALVTKFGHPNITTIFGYAEKTKL